jgi:hypothetical protein
MRSIRDVMQRRVTKRFPLYDDAIAIKKNAAHDDRLDEKSF